jgi:predicted AAA+ superfamily ATPase
MVERQLGGRVVPRIGAGKAIIIMGARQVGKTTFVRSLLAGREDVLWLNGDEHDVQALFENISASRLRVIIGRHRVVVVDEAQRIANVGLRLKLLTDQLPDVQLVATGSSSFELANALNEPLTGRKWEFTMFPLSFAEMAAHHGLLEERRLMPHRLVFGYYPEIVSRPGDEAELLKLLTESYLYKDVLTLDRIKKSDGLVKLLRALAFQIGVQVSFNELARLCGIDQKTVEKYVDILEQAYIVFRLNSYSRNLRNELKASRKIYFYDNGVRNAVLSNFSQPENRTDIGALWENFLVSERAKRNHNSGDWPTCWFWRTSQQKEIDYLEEKNGTLAAYEFKWGRNANVKASKQFRKAYPEATFQIVTPDNFDEFLA